MSDFSQPTEVFRSTDYTRLNKSSLFLTVTSHRRRRVRRHSVDSGTGRRPTGSTSYALSEQLTDGALHQPYAQGPLDTAAARQTEPPLLPRKDQEQFGEAEDCPSSPRLPIVGRGLRHSRPSISVSGLNELFRVFTVILCVVNSPGLRSVILNYFPYVSLGRKCTTSPPLLTAGVPLITWTPREPRLAYYRASPLWCSNWSKELASDPGPP